MIELVVYFRGVVAVCDFKLYAGVDARVLVPVRPHPPGHNTQLFPPHAGLPGTCYKYNSISWSCVNEYGINVST